MDKELISRNILAEANAFYDSAHEEFCRPEEDVVPYMICRSAYKSVGKYLSAFLSKNGYEISESMSLESLLDQCRDCHPKFSDLDLDILVYGNAHHEEAVTADWKTIQDYLDLANQTRQLIAEDLIH